MDDRYCYKQVSTFVNTYQLLGEGNHLAVVAVHQGSAPVIYSDLHLITNPNDNTPSAPAAQVVGAKLDQYLSGMPLQIWDFPWAAGQKQTPSVFTINVNVDRENSGVIGQFDRIKAHQWPFANSTMHSWMHVNTTKLIPSPKARDTHHFRLSIGTTALEKCITKNVTRKMYHEKCSTENVTRKCITKKVSVKKGLENRLWHSRNESLAFFKWRMILITAIHSHIP